MTVQHTPGPWRRGIGDDANRVFDSQGRIVAERTGYSDGHLIAAAPDMLAALQALVGDIQDYEHVNNLAPSPGKQDCWQSVTNARAAIAKATGRNNVELVGA